MGSDYCINCLLLYMMVGVSLQLDRFRVRLGMSVQDYLIKLGEVHPLPTLSPMQMERELRSCLHAFMSVF